MKFKILAALVALVWLSACSSNDEKKQALKPANLVDFEATLKLKKLWSKPVGSGRDKRYSRFVPGISSTAIYVSDVDGNVSALDKDSGKQLWKVKIKDKAISAGVGFNTKSLFVGTYDGELIALDAKNGETLWQGQASSEILSVPAANSDVVVAQTIDGRLFGFDAKSGELRWRYDHTVPSLTIRGLADPVITNTQVFSAFGNGQVVVLDPSDGASQWSARVSQPKGVNELEKIIDIDGSLQVTGSYVFAATYQGAIAAFAKRQGKAVWKQDFSTFYSLAANSSQVIGVTEESHVVAFNSANGTINWSNDALHRRDVKAPAIFNDLVVAIDDDGYMHVMSLETGDFVYRFKPVGDGFTSAPQVYDDKLLVLSDNGKLTAYVVAK